MFLHGHHLDGGLLSEQLERSEIIETSEVEEAGQVGLESLLRNFPGVEILHEVTNHLSAVLDSGLVLLLLLHVSGHHGEHDGGLGGQDHPVAGELLPVLAEDGEVGEQPVLVVAEHNGDVSREIKLGGGLPKIIRL